MNPASAAAPQAQPPPLPPPPPLQQQQQQQQPNRPSTSCGRHPQEQFTGFCPECLCERLAELHPSTTPSPSSSSKPPTSSTAVAALKAIFRPSSSSSTTTAAGKGRPPTSSLLPELRRTQSFSASKNEAFTGAFEPQRRSCDVRARNSTLWNLFTHEAEKKTLNKEASEAEVTNQVAVVDSTEEEVAEEENREQNDVVEKEDEEEGGESDEIRVSEERNVNETDEIVEEIVVEEEQEELKTMKDHIDLDSSSSQPKKDSKMSLWSAASVFSKKLQKWRQKQKTKKSRNGTVNGGDGGTAALPVEKPIGRQFRDTQSEIADYGFGRRSCDTDPRFSLDVGRISLDAGRMSFDDPRYSFDEPRASWDGYLLGRPAFPKAMPTMLSVVEDAVATPAAAPVAQVLRTDAYIPVEEPLNSINGGDDDGVPGGTAQTREYYSDSSRRRKSLDRSNSMRRTSVSSVPEEMEEFKCGSIANSSVNGNAKVTPAGADYVDGPKLAFLDRSNSVRDDCSSETFDLGFGDAASVVGNGDRKDQKKSRRWGKAWNIWGLIHRRGSSGGGNNKDEDDDRYSRANGVERSFSESWPDLRGDRNGDARSAFNGRVFRSNSSVSWRNTQGVGGGGSFGNMRKNCVQSNGNGKKGKEEFVLERNRSARYSPNNVDNGLLRFYLTPMRGSRRNGSVKSRSNQAHSIARSVLRLY